MHEYCIPEKWIDKETYDLQAQQEHRSEPGNSNPVVLQPGEVVAQKIFIEPSVQISPDLVEAINELSGELAQLITAALPSLMGSGDEHNETGKGIAMMREQALGQMGIAWGASQQLLAQCLELAVKLFARKAEDGRKLAVKVPGSKSQPDSVKEIDAADLKAGDFYAEVDQSFPDTRAMRRAVFNSVLAMSANSPALQQMLALPENQELFKEMVDEDLEVPGADARIQQLREIEELVKSPPNMPPPEAVLMQAAQAAQAQMAQGAPAPPEPSPQQIQQLQLQAATPTVPIDPDWDMHQFHIEVIQNWLASEECQKQVQAGNQDGIENVKAHGRMHKQYLQSQAQPPAGKPPSVSISFKDLPPDGQLQAAKEAGITLNPQNLIAQHEQELAASSQPKPKEGEPNAS